MMISYQDACLTFDVIYALCVFEVSGEWEVGSNCGRGTRLDVVEVQLRCQNIGALKNHRVYVFNFRIR